MEDRAPSSRGHPLVGARLVPALLLLLLANQAAARLAWSDRGKTGPGANVDAPAARFGHRACGPLAFPEGFVVVYGGLVEAAADAAGSHALTATSEVWMYDPEGQSWEVALQEAGAPAAGLPAPRAFHGIAAFKGSVLVCGGHGGTDSGPSSLDLIREAASDRIDCWWLTPMNYMSVRWDRLVIEGSTQPEKRSGHSLTADASSGTVVLFGGLGKTAALGDCWTMRAHERPPVGDSDDFAAQKASYSWQRCDHGGQMEASEPTARWGHVAILFQSRLYIHGGFSRDKSGRVYANDDMWVMTKFSEWEKVAFSSGVWPAPRALHAAWLQNLKLCMTGGEGREGSGEGSVLDETWCYNIVPKTWSHLARSPQAPTASHLAIAPLDDGAIAFGGLHASNRPSQELYEFVGAELRWRRVSLAGPSPARRAGHVSFINSDTSEMFVSLGQTGLPPGAGGVVNDVWVLKLGTRIWRTLQPNAASRPAPVAYAASTTVQTLHLGVIFGGFGVKQAWLNSSDVIPVAQGGAWALQLSGDDHERIWRKITAGNGMSPPARGLAAMVAMDPFHLGGSILEHPVVMFGGGDWACFSSGCKVLLFVLVLRDVSP